MRTSSRQVEIDAAKEIGPAMGTLAAMARTDPAVFNQFVLRDEETGYPITLAPMHEEWQDVLTQHERAVLWAHTESGKAVPLGTAIPTPSGWTTMRDVEVGDVVLARDGSPCLVTGVSAVQHGRTVYRVKFDDGGEALADADHRWIAMKSSRIVKSAGEVQGSGLCACGCGSRPTLGKIYVHNHHGRVRNENGWRVMTTQGMLDAGIAEPSGARRPDGSDYPRSRWRIPLARPVQFDERSLPIDPYVLGVWLGDGDSATTTITFHEDDRFIFDRCAAIVGAKPDRSTPRAPHVRRGSLGPATHSRAQDGLRAALIRTGLLSNKHIPAEYLIASIAQREELLAGLLDTDGHITPRGIVEFTNTNERLARGALELARSLGFKTRICSKRMKLYGRDVGECWRVTFTPRRPVFRLPRKLAAQKYRPPGTADNRADCRMVVAIEAVDTEPVKCISVDSVDHSYLIGHDFTVTHNSVGVSIGRALYEIGKNPNIRILVVSASSGQAKKIIKAVKNYIERSLEYRMVFPNVVPDKSDTRGMWREDAFIVHRSTMSKDPTMQAVGYNGNVLGGRYDIIIIDDYLTDENTYSDRQREKYYRWLKSTIEGRKTGRSKLWFIGNAWHIDDAMHRYAAEEATFSKKYPVRTADGSAWPEVWPDARIEKEIQNRGPIESQRSLFCDPVSDAERKFKIDYVQKALAKGDGLELAWALSVVPPGYRTITGVDLAVSKRDNADETALVTIAVDDRPQPIGTQERQLLDVDAGKWSGPEIVAKIFEVQHRYNSIVIVESNGAQQFIKQFVEDRTAVPVKAFYTGRNKVDPAFGIQSLALEMSAGKWVIPNQGGATRGIHAQMNNQVRKLLGEMLRYDPASHTGDRLIACWLAREGARMTANPAGVGKRPRRT